MNCVYDGWAAQVFAFTQLIPWLVPLALSAASIGRDARGRWGKQLLHVWFGLHLTVMQVFLYVLQFTLDRPRPDPYCPSVYSYGVPATAAFYIAALYAFIVGYAILWRVRLSAFYWVATTAILVFVPGILVWWAYNTWYEVLLALALGAGTTAPFLAVVRFLVLPEVPLLLRARPWRWFPCIDTYMIMSSDEPKL
jgi:hypothetical protein